MRSTLDELLIELDELEALVASIAPVNAALAGHENTVVQQYVSIRRRFDYAAFAVVLYALFEKFVENLIMSYARLEAKRVEYSALPRKLMDKHLTGTAELLWRRRLGEGRYVGMSDLGAIKNLFECLSGTNPYTLNEAVVSAHDANLRANEVDSLFAAIGIEQICEQARHSDAMITWYSDMNDLQESPPVSVNRTVIEERLKDIVERRNQVAHNGGNPDNLLGPEAMREALGFIKNFAQSIFGLVVGRYLEFHHSASTDRIELTLRDGVGPYRNGKVVIVEMPPQRLFVGQPVFTIIKSTGARWGRILSLHLNDAELQDLAGSTNAPNGVGVQLDFKFPNNANSKLVALACDDDLVWSPKSEQ